MWWNCLRHGQTCRSAATRTNQVFLVLAHVGKADALITGDADILAMREDFPGLIMTAEAFAARQA